MSHLGERIRVTRENAGLSQLALAQRVGIDRSHISKLETGETDGSLKTVKKIAEALGVPLSVLLEEPRQSATG